MSNRYPAFRAAATQIAPCFLDLQAGVDKACRYIEEAAKNGAKLIGFPEAYLGGYPQWAFLGDPFDYGGKFWKRLYLNAFEIPGPEMAQLAACARKNQIYVCMSGTELDHGSLYLTQVWFDDTGNLMGKHRKIRPTCMERTIWGEGDGSTMPVFETKLGNLGGLMCWEHRMPANLMIMNAQNEQVHISAWPCGQGDPDHMFSRGKNISAAEYYAATTGTFVIMCSYINTPEMRDILADGDPQRAAMFTLGGGHAGIFNPRGTCITEYLPHDQEGLLYADIDLSEIIESKYLIDCAGHYSKASVASLTFHQDPQPGVRFEGTPCNPSIPYQALTDQPGPTKG